MDNENWVEVGAVIDNEIKEKAGVKYLADIYQEIIKGEYFPIIKSDGKSNKVEFRTKEGIIYRGYLYARAIKLSDNLYLPAWVSTKNIFDDDYFDLSAVTEWRYL